MKLNEMADRIAKTCELRPKAVLAVQKETFRLLGEAMDKGERIVIPAFGSFATRELPQADGTTKKAVKFRRKTDESQPETAEAAPEADAEADAEKKKARRAKRAEKKDAAAKEAAPDDDDA
jgi:nucleoid DNA-binding protein